MARERANGEGSFRKKGSSYEYRVCFELPNGETIPKSFSGKTKKICREKSDKFKESLNNKIIIENLTLKEWSTKWLETYKKGTISADTYRSYTTDLNIIKNDAIAKLNIDKIRPINIQEFFNRVSEKSLSTQKKLRFMLISIFNTAIENDLCTKNPVKNIKLTNNEVQKREAFTEKEVNTIVKFAQTHSFGLAIMIMLYSGVRRGELLALTWNCYDSEKGILTVNGTLTASDGIKAGDTSTKKHYREIPIPPILSNILDAEPKKSIYILGNSNSFMNLSTFRKRYDDFFTDLSKWCQENKIDAVRKLTTHSLRHTYGTMLYRRGVDIKTIQTLMGHSTIDVTANIYTHTDISTSQKAVILAFSG